MSINLSSNSLAIRSGNRSLSRLGDASKTGATSAAGSRVFENKVSITPSTRRFEEATEIALSPSAQASLDGKERAARSLSNATTYVNVAQDAVSSVTDLLRQAKQTAKASETEVNQERKALLAEESATLLAEIDSVLAQSEVNGESVFNSGSRSFQFDMKKEAPTGDSSYTFNISEFSVSRAELGVAELDATSIAADPTAAQERIAEAETQLTTTRASVEKSRQTLNTVAQEFGITSAQDYAGTSSIQASESDRLADTIASSIRNSVVDSTSAQALDAERVGALIADGDEEQLVAKKKKPDSALKAANTPDG